MDSLLNSHEFNFLDPQSRQAIVANTQRPPWQVRDAITQLEQMPDVPNVKVLTQHTYGYRLRVGDYRVLFDWDGAIQVTSIQEVKKRDERTY